MVRILILYKSNNYKRDLLNQNDPRDSKRVKWGDDESNVGNERGGGKNFPTWMTRSNSDSNSTGHYGPTDRQQQNAQSSFHQAQQLGNQHNQHSQHSQHNQHRQHKQHKQHRQQTQPNNSLN